MTIHLYEDYPPRHNQKWTPREDQIVLRLKMRIPLHRVARRIGRTERSVVSRLCNIGVVLPQRMRPALGAWYAAVAFASDRTGVPPHEITSKSRVRARARARWLAFKWLRDKGFSLPGIGAVAGVDHTTVIHGLRRLEELAAAARRQREAANHASL